MTRRATFTTATLTAALAAALAAAAGSPAFAAGIWDGNGNANNSGGWSTAANWDDNLVPNGATVDVILGDVTSGNRVITYSGATSSRALDQLSIVQDAAGPTNTLVLNNNSGVNLSLGGSGSSPAISLTGANAANIAITILNNNGISFGANAELQTFTNPGTITLGSTSASTSHGRIEYSDSSGTIGFTYVNNGTTTLNNESAIRNTVVQPNLAVTNNGILNLAGNTTGVKIWKEGATTGAYGTVTLTNSSTGTTNVSRNASISSGVGLTIVGTDTSGTSRYGATVTNSGIFNIAANSELLIRSKRAAVNEAVAQFNNTGGTLNIGDVGSTTDAGTLSLAVRTLSGTNANLGMRVDNNSTGIINLYGASSIITSSASGSEVDGDRIQVTNAGTINLRDTSSIGETTLSQTAFTNSGTLNKTGSGTASVLSRTATGGAINFSTNTGLIHIQNGALQFTTALTSSAAASEIRYTLGNADISAALLLADGLTLGAATGSQLTLNFSAPLTGNRTWNLWDTTNVATGQFTDVVLTGSITGSFGSSPTTWSAGSYDFTLDYPTGVLTAALIPEPAALALAAVGLALLAPRRRRRA